MSEIAAERAKEIVEVATKYGAYSWTDGVAVNDATIAEAAAALVDGATQASTNGTVNEAVLEILHVAQVEPVSDATRKAYSERFNVQLASTPAAAEAPSAEGGFSASAPQSAPSEAQGAFGQPQSPPAPVAEQAASGAAPAEDSGLLDISHIFPGYDDMKLPKIKEAVLASAKSGDLSPEEWELIKAYESAHEERKTILKLEPEFKAPDPEPTPEPTNAFGGTPQPSVAGRSDLVVPAGDGEGLNAFYNGETISRAQQEGLPIPPQTTGEGVVMPIDITSTSDQELSRLATAYHSLFARTQWLISQEEGRERAAEQLEHDAHRDAYLSAYENHKSEIPEGKAGPTALDAARKLAEKDADNAKPVQVWRTRRTRHAADARELKALSTGYDKAVWRINEELGRRARLQTSAMAAPR